MRGKIRNRERAKQLRDFSGLRFGTITPTDIDAFLEFKNLLFIIIEAKGNGAGLPHGQRLALERLCDAIQGTVNPNGAERQSYLLIVHHDTPADCDVDYAQSHVVSVRHKQRWQTPKTLTTCKEAVTALMERWL